MFLYNKGKKKMIASFLCLVSIVVCNLSVVHATTDSANKIIMTVGKTDINVFGEIKNSDVPPMAVNGRVMLPIRIVAEALGARVAWNAAQNKIIIVKAGEDTVIEVVIGEEKALINQKEYFLDSPAFVKDQRTYLPVRFVSQSLDASVDWDGETQTVIISKNVADTNVDADESYILYSQNICPAPTTSRVSGGITFTPMGDGSYLLQGTATTSSYYNLYLSKDTFPENFFAGCKYVVDYYHLDRFVKLNIRYIDATGTYTTIFNSNHTGVFEIPNDAVGLQIRFYVGQNHTVNHLVFPRIYKEGSEAYTTIVGERKPPAMLSIVYDDGHNDFYDYVLPIIKSKNVPIATAIIPGYVNDNPSIMTWDKISECQQAGAEVLVHTAQHDEEYWDNLGLDGVMGEYTFSKNTLAEKGFNPPNALIFSGGSAGFEVCREACSKIYDYGFNADVNKINYYGLFDPYFINRFGTDNENLDTLKGWLDELSEADTGWMIWMRHNSNATKEDQTEAARILSDAIDYAIEKQIPIVTIEQGLNEYLK